MKSGRIAPITPDNAVLMTMKIRDLNRVYEGLNKNRRVADAKRVWAHIVMKSRGKEFDPNFDLSKVPNSVMKMYPNGEQMVSLKKMIGNRVEGVTPNAARSLLSELPREA